MDRFLSPLILPRLRFVTVALVVLCSFGAAVPSPAQSGKRAASPTPAKSNVPKATSSPTPFKLPDPVAKVDGQTVSRAELERVAGALAASNNQQLKNIPEAEKLPFYRQVLDQIIIDRLVSVRSRAEPVDDLKVEQAYNSLQSQYPDIAAFDEQLKANNQTPESVRANLRGQLAQQQWLEKQITDDAKMAPEEVEKFYKESPPDEFDVPEQVCASHILVGVRRDAPPEDVLAAEKKLAALSERLKKGEPFDVVARDSSEDPNAKQTSGDLGYFRRERVLPEVGEAAFKLKNGETSAPVRSQFGLHLIKVSDRKAAHHASFEEARERITEYLTRRRRAAAVNKIIATLRGEAKIENFLS